MTRYVDPWNTGKLEREFREFHGKHPEVYDELRELALDLKRRGYKRLGIGLIAEVVRWRSMRSKPPGEEFKINNNHRAFYSRMLMDREPELDGMFIIREQGVPSHVA